jgi:fatty-acid desaturase
MYDRQKSNKDLIRDYGIEVPDSWIDRNIYNKFNFAGPILSFIIFYLLFNFWGLIPWVFNIFWMIFLKSEAVNADLILPEYFNEFLTSLQRSGKFYG